ncbi:MAG TPA: MFS transporter, partial [Anaerolineales bacterium]|nr:MFS transporter [Anaerolineales bacterium]
PPDMLTSANSLNGLSARMTGIIGPSIGAALVVAGGTPLTFALDALSFFISALFVFPLLRGNAIAAQSVEKVSETPVRPKSMKETVKQGFGDLRQGFNAIITIPYIWITILMYGFLNMSEGSPRAVAMPFLIKNDLGADVALLGIFGTVFSLGFVVGAVLLGQFKRLRKRGIVSYITPLIQGCLLLLFGLKFPIPVLIGSMFVYGFTYSVFGLIWHNALQEMVPHEMLGRVYSIDALGSWVMLPIGFALAGWATDLVGAPTVFLVGGFSTIALAFIGLSNRAIRNLD